MKLAAAASLLLTIHPLLSIGPPREAAPSFRAKSIDGEEFTNDSLKGKVTLLQFWTTWCRFCRRDQPVVDEIVKEFSDRGLVVLAVSVNESKKTVAKYLAESPRSCKVILNENTNLPALFEAKAFPLYVVIDRDGKIAGTQRGAGGPDVLHNLLSKAGLK
jgi:thiol-disulfide isomerase/thioredoxin